MINNVIQNSQQSLVVGSCTTVFNNNIIFTLCVAKRVLSAIYIYCKVRSLKQAQIGRLNLYQRWFCKISERREKRKEDSLLEIMWPVKIIESFLAEFGKCDSLQFFEWEGKLHNGKHSRWHSRMLLWVEQILEEQNLQIACQQTN